MRFFYDTEFVDNGRTIDLVSIGIVADTGETYYAIDRDMPQQHVQTHPWMSLNVWPHLPLDPYLNLDVHHPDVKTKSQISREVEDFLTGHITDTELWAYYSAYDHVVLAQLWGPMMAMPEGIPYRTNDIAQVTEATGQSLIASRKPHHALYDAQSVRDTYYAIQHP